MKLKCEKYCTKLCTKKFDVKMHPGNNKIFHEKSGAE